MVLLKLAMIVSVLVSALPLILIKKGIIESSDINTIIAGVSFFYFPVVVGKMLK